ncbi:MAG: hypothetical protein J6Q13_00010 [Clostridia bacterium]|nr:hypothetical protein [Clostridia bacterium]
MLDKKTTSVLKALNKLADGNAYKVVTTDEILSNLSQKSQFDLETIKQSIEFLEKQQYINIKFFEEKTYCYSLMPKARIYLEQETPKTTAKNNKNQLMQYVYIMIASFIGTMFALLIFFYLTF